MLNYYIIPLNAMNLKLKIPMDKWMKRGYNGAKGVEDDI